MTASDMALKIAVKISALGVAPFESAIDAINVSVRFLALRLADRNSDLARSNYTIRMSRNVGALPTDFNGLSGVPYCDGEPLDVLPASYDPLTAPGTPKYYDIVDDLLYVYPTPSGQVTITGKYWVNPETLTNSDTIPYGGRFDSLIAGMATKFCVSGSEVMSSPQFMAEVENSLDVVLFPRKPALPARRPYSGF